MTKSPKTPTFESAMAELDAIVAEMEAGQLPLEKSLLRTNAARSCLSFARARWPTRNSRSKYSKTAY